MTGFGATIDALNYSQLIGGFVAACAVAVFAFFAVSLAVDARAERRRRRDV